MEKQSGHCLCESIQFEAELPEKFSVHCHCESCRKAHGAAFVTWVGFPKEQFKLTRGQPELQVYASSKGVKRSFCKRCGSTLFYESERWPGEVHIAGANLDTMAQTPPKKHVFASEQVSWIELQDSLPKSQ